MPDSHGPDAERAMQRRFRKIELVPMLALAALTLLFHSWTITLPNRVELGQRTAAIAFYPVALDPRGFAPLRLVGAWRLSGGDPRFGGISALALDRGELLALSDSGVLVRFAKPSGRTGIAAIRELPDGPGDPGFKSMRDSEALVADPLGRGWWVAFENRDEVWLYDRDFRRSLGHAAIRDRTDFSRNVGIEGMAPGLGGIWLVHERGRLLRLRLAPPRPYSIQRMAMKEGFGRLSDAASIPGGRTWLIARNLGPFGFRNRLVELGLRRSDGTFVLRSVARLGVGPFDNVEALAAERMPDGTTRLWLMTDDNFQRPMRTLLLALDVPKRL